MWRCMGPSLGSRSDSAALVGASPELLKDIERGIPAVKARPSSGIRTKLRLVKEGF